MRVFVRRFVTELLCQWVVRPISKRKILPENELEYTHFTNLLIENTLLNNLLSRSMMFLKTAKFLRSEGMKSSAVTKKLATKNKL